MALEVTLQDAFGTNCLKMEQIDPKATSVQVLVDSHVAEIDLDNLVSLSHIVKRFSYCNI